MNKYQVIAITHKTSGLDEVGRYHLSDDVFETRLKQLKEALELDELFYLSTCNRVEFHFVHTSKTEDLRANFFKSFNPSWTTEDIKWAIDNSLNYRGEKAVKHLFNVASSIDSLVIGEREIITQVRNAYEKCTKLGLTGDFIRLVVKKTIETAKEVYTQTQIAQKPVSVVSLAYHHLKSLHVDLNARILIVGSGKTNTSMSHFLKKHGYTNFSVFNRTRAHAEILATEIKGTAYGLNELNTYSKGFDVLVTCTGSNEPIITKEIYTTLLAGDTDRKVVVDLAIPNDVDLAITKNHKVTLITVDKLKQVAEKNLKEREKELEKCHTIIDRNTEEFRKIQKERAVEIAMREVPKKIREITDIAINEVFANELKSMDPDSKEVLNKILSYMEKKYISMPMKMAKNIMLEETEL